MSGARVPMRVTGDSSLFQLVPTLTPIRSYRNVPFDQASDELLSRLHRGLLSAGVIVLKGRVELGSLITFFENHMARDNWQVVSTFKSTRTLLLFQKENRWCVINITDDTYNTHVEIWVAPTTNPIDSGLLK